MLKHIVDAHGGRLPDDIAVVFANTGMERPETLDFVDTWRLVLRPYPYSLLPVGGE